VTTTPGGAELILGTVQFGLRYGIAGRDEAVPEDEVRSILAVAVAGGIRTLDTAPVYGDIEQRLDRLCDGLPLSVISKIAPVPLNAPSAIEAVRASVAQSRARLGARLSTVLFHAADDLLRPDAEALWRAATDEAGDVRVGVSVYDPATLAVLRARHGVSVAQIPASPLDQRLRMSGLAAPLAGIEVHARSVFLQGLLLMRPDEVRLRVPAAIEAHGRWLAWCASREVSPLVAALGITRGLPGVQACVVGVDRRSHLQEILDAATVAVPMDAPELHCDHLDVIDPRRWNAA